MKKPRQALIEASGVKKFPEITFDEAINTLVESGNKTLSEFYWIRARYFIQKGEIKLAEIFNFDELLLG